MEELIKQLLSQWVQAQPWVMALVTVIAVARAVFKPAMALIDKFIEVTPSKDDDTWWSEFKDKVISAPWYPYVRWFIDFLLSIKLPEAKPGK